MNIPLTGVPLREELGSALRRARLRGQRRQLRRARRGRTCSAVDQPRDAHARDRRRRRRGDRRQDLPRRARAGRRARPHRRSTPTGPPARATAPTAAASRRYCSGQALERDATELGQRQARQPPRRLARRRRQGLRRGRSSRPPRTATPTPCSSSRTRPLARRRDRRLRERLRARAARDRRRPVARRPPLPRSRDRGGGDRALPALLAAGRRSRSPQGGADAGVIGAGLLAAQEVEGADAGYSRARDHDRKGRMTTGRHAGARRALRSTRSAPSRWTRCEKANSGHPGAPMALAPLAYLLYTRVMKHNPAEPGLVRPRPLRALGRARVDAALLVALPDGLRAHARRPQELPPARQPDRRSPRARRRGRHRGHHRPARPGHLDVRRHGARRARCWPRASTRPATSSIDHHTFTIASDGDMQEGVASEACSLAGHLGLGKLIVFYDNNHIPLAGDDRDRVLRGRRQALRGLRLARPGPRRGPRARAHRGGHRRRRGRPGPALADHAAHAHRLRLAEQAGHRRGARLAARRGGGAAHEGGLRLDPDEPLLRPRGGARRTSARRPASAAQRAGGRVAAARRGLPGASSRTSGSELDAGR